MKVFLSPCVPMRCWIALIFLCCSALSLAGFDFRLEIEAPGSVKQRLEKYLDVVRAVDDEKTTAEYVEHLAATTESEIRALTATEGYFSPVIKIDYQRDASPPLLKVMVEPGETVKVTRFNLLLSGAVRDTPSELAAMEKKVRALWLLAEGRVFTQADWEAGKKAAHDLFYDARYPAVRIARSAARIDPARNAAELDLEIDSGPVYHYGPLQIKGLQRYPEHLIREQIQFDPQGEYRREDLVELQNRIQSLTHFSLALVEADLATSPPYLATIRVEVREVPLNKVTPSIGYTTSTGFNVGLAYTYFNLFDRGWLSEDQIKLAQKEQSASTAIVFPRLGGGFEHRVYLAYNRTDVEDLITETWTQGLSRTQQDFKLTRTWTLEYQTERRYLADGTVERPETATLKYLWLRRDLDNPRDPRRGNLLQLESGGALRGVFSDETYIRLYGRSAQYWPVSEKGVLIGRVELGETFARVAADVPSAWLFRAGGGGSVRGYDYQSLGPIKGGSVVPGRIILTSSLEYQQPVYKDWRAVVFGDHGNASNTWASYRGFTGAGFGVRWGSPAGVFGADLAQGLDEHRWRFQVAIGLVF